ncbi:hypothetical protein SAMN06273572_102423 [Monaibacterium marinum]|uniref:Uncharacterized protein n=1 Tax=Pontivivens marinum TaxID=1690039 RepID=A0A2C9CRF8_9RHOB|nr:hypothetical protein SAMN06273572_102423 [Monaibacterium marinum]
MRGDVYESHSIHPQPERSPILPYFVEVYRDDPGPHQQPVDTYRRCCTASKIIFHIPIHRN